jgi:penicillin-binding protein 2
MIEDQGWRITAFKIILIMLIAVYSVKLFSMQILSGQEYLTRAQDISRRTFTIPAQRGEIYDRNYTKQLAMNKDSFAVNITPAEVPKGKMEDIIYAVSSIITVPTDEITAKLPKQFLQSFQPVEIAANVPFSSISALAERKNTLPGVSWISKPVRNYTDSGSLSHVLGYVGDITRDELTSLYNLGYQQGDIIGKSGVEKQYDELLRGKEGREIRTVDVRGRRIAGRENVRIHPEVGKNLVLSIDYRLQTLVEKALGQRIGTALVIRPSTGEVLAMVSYPWYDPNIFTDGLSTDYKKLADDPNKPFLNRAIQSSYAPGSTFKIVISTGIYSEKSFPPEQTILCQGVLNFGNRDWLCHVKRPGHGRLNLHNALAQSCNIYYMTAGRDHLGPERIASYAKEYGYGELTEIDLPGEIPGFIPTPQWKERRLQERWVQGDTMNMSIGQGFTLLTPIQMTNMICMLVNDGKVYIPHILKEVRDPATGAVERNVKPELLHESSLSPEIFEMVRRDMRNVITTGTAQYPLNIKSVQIAGKTGTAEVGFIDRWHSWFTAFAPYDNRNAENAIALTVIVEAANKWEWWAPYASALIFQGYFNNQTYEEAIRALGFQYLIPIQDRRE